MLTPFSRQECEIYWDDEKQGQGKTALFFFNIRQSIGIKAHSLSTIFEGQLPFSSSLIRQSVSTYQNIARNTDNAILNEY